MTTNDYTLVIGDKNFSSWSLRPWLALKALRHSLHRGARQAAAARLQGRDPAPYAFGQGPGVEDEARSSSGTASPFSSISPSGIPSIGSGRRIARRGRRRAASRPRCMRASAAAQRHVHGSAEPAANSADQPGARSGYRADRRDLEGYARALRRGRYLSCSGISPTPMPCTRRWRRASAAMASTFHSFGDDGTGAAYMEATFALPAMAEWTEGAKAETGKEPAPSGPSWSTRGRRPFGG